MRLVAEPYIPFALWIALAFLAIIVLVWYGLTSRMATTRNRKATILALMGMTLALPLLVLLNLTWIENVPPPAGKPVVRVIVDTSASMLTPDVDGQTRLSTAQAIASSAVSKLKSEFDVRVSTFDQNSRPTDLAILEKLGSNSEDAGTQTNLSTAIASSVNEDIPQGQSILLVSDGIHNAGFVNDVIAAATKAQAMDVPVFTTTLGGKVDVKNVSVSLRSPQELAFVGQKVTSVTLVDSAGFGNRPMKISLWKNGQPVNEVAVTPNESGRGEAVFEIEETTPGLYRYEVRANELRDEVTLADNRSTLMFRVVNQPIKMMLIEGKPYWDTKFLVRRLAADQSLELTSIIRMAENRYMKRTAQRAGEAVASDEGSKGLESTTIISDVGNVLSAESLSDTQILVLGRNAEYYLNDDTMDVLRNWISRQGGSLVCARGAPSAQISQRLGQILPVKWSSGRESRFRVSMTTQGEELRWLAAFGDGLEAMPSLATVANVSRREGLSNVLAASVSDSGGSDLVPVISYQPYGSGRTVVVEGAGMWRWALLSPEHAEQEAVYPTLWRSLLRWLVSRAGLMPGQDISVQPDRVIFDTNDEATATMLIRLEKIAEAPRIRLYSENQFDQEFAATPVGHDPGVFRFDFGQLPAGQYNAEVKQTSVENSAATMAFDVRERWVEKLELNARPDLMQRIAETSGGSVMVEATPEAFAAKFKDHLTQSHPSQYRRVTLWDRWWVMTALLALWATTWIVRRRSGLV